MSAPSGPSFNIVWVEDDPDAMEDQMEEISTYIQDQGLVPNLIKSKDGKDIPNIITKQTVDIVVTDYVIANGVPGNVVIRSIKNSGLWIDILLYSAGKMSEVEMRKGFDYPYVDVVSDKAKVLPRLKRIVDKNLRKWDDLVLLRGVVITRTIDIEIELNNIFSKYFQIYGSDLEDDFHELVMENYFGFEGKMKLLRKIVEKKRLGTTYNPLLKRLLELQKTRNIMAHCKEDPKVKYNLVSTGERKKYLKADMIEILKDTGKIYEDLEKLNGALFP